MKIPIIAAPASRMRDTNIVRSDDLRNENRKRLLDSLRQAGPSSPAQLAESTGLSAASISSLSAQMVEQGFIKSTRCKAKNGVSRGRPQSLIDLDGSAANVITLNLSLDQICVQRISYSGELLHSNTIELKTREISEQELLKACTHAASQALKHPTGSTVQYIGVAFQGVTEHSEGILAWSPIIKHQNVNLASPLQKTFKLPISVNNNCRLIAEALYNSSHKSLGNSFAVLLFSHGVGLGLYIDGKPFSGIRSSAMELGHLRFKRDGMLCRCGRRGCIEAYAADYGVERLATGNSIDDKPVGRVDKHQIRKLSDAAMAGEDSAAQAFAVAGASVGEGLATLFTLLDPMPVALVGRSKDSIALMRPGFQSVFRNQPNTTIDIDELLHCFEDDDPLIQAGLAQNTLALVDKQFAYNVKKPHATS